MVEVQFHPLEKAEVVPLKYAVIAARESDGRWLFSRHRRRQTWELPGGHREPGEDIADAARRELWEETGVTQARFFPVSVYSVLGADGPEQTEPNYGLLYFAQVTERGPLPASEIGAVRALPAGEDGGLPLPNTYPLIQPFLWERVQAFLQEQGL